jgi:hypothetical protein
MDITPELPNDGQKSLRYTAGLFGIFQYVSNILYIYCTISRGRPKYVLRNPGRESLLYTDM